MKIEEALLEIEDIIKQIDPVQLYQASLGHELQNIVRKVRNELREEDVRIGTKTF
ncbi:MAG: hypothetical protein ACXADH_12780 [Candidatus Kariarchaeaceae archaeon]|jgi:hypothetical protein